MNIHRALKYADNLKISGTIKTKVIIVLADNCKRLLNISKRQFKLINNLNKIIKMYENRLDGY